MTRQNLWQFQCIDQNVTVYEAWTLKTLLKKIPCGVYSRQSSNICRQYICNLTIGVSGRELNVPYSPFLYQSFHKRSSRNWFHRGIFLPQVSKRSCDSVFLLHYLATFVAWLRSVCLLQIDRVEQKGGLQTCSISFWVHLGFSDFSHWLDEETGDVWFNVLNLGVYFDFLDSVFC